MPAERERLSEKRKLVEMERSEGERLGEVETQKGEIQVN